MKNGLMTITLCLLVCISISIKSGYAFTPGDTLKIAFLAKLMESPEDTSVVSILQHDQKVRCLERKGSWVKITAQNNTGWIREKNIYTDELPIKQDSGKPSAGFSIILLISVLITGALFILSLKVRKNKPNHTKNPKIIYKESEDSRIVLILSKTDKPIKSDLYNGYKKLSTCFDDLGFPVHYADTTNLDFQDQPFIIAVDYEIFNNFRIIEKMFEKKYLSDLLPVIYYNIPNPENFKASKLLKKTYFFSKSIKESDILKIIGKVVSREYNEKEDFHLQGKIKENSLIEIIQMVSISGKRGIIKIFNKNSKLIGLIGFEDGKIVFSKTSKHKNRKAVKSIIRLSRGYFEYIEGYKSKQTTSIEPMSVILDTVKEQDEMRREAIA